MLKKAYLEITNVCNLACSFCPGTQREKRFMTETEFKILAGKLRPYTDYLYFHLMGEPLLHPELGRFLKIAGEMSFKVIITTNGTLLPIKKELLLSAPALHRVNISLQSYEANRLGGLAQYITACAAFAGQANQAGKLCVLRLWNRNGLDSMNGEIETLLSQQFPQPWTEGRGNLRLADRVYLEPGERFDWPGMETEDRGEYCFCYGLRDQIGILVDGTVVPCCLDHEGDIPLGNLLTQELKNIMSTEKARNIYNGFSQRRAIEALCRRCGYARRFT